MKKILENNHFCGYGTAILYSFIGVVSVPVVYQLKRSRRRTVSLSVNKDLAVIVKAPLHLGQEKIDLFVQKNEQWIDQQRAILQQKQLKENEWKENHGPEYRKRAYNYLYARVLLYQEKMGLFPKSIKITDAKTRLGSCSAQNNICFSWRLMIYEPEAIDYVIVHELAHIQYKNHSKDFYACIETVLPDYRERKRLLKS